MAKRKVVVTIKCKQVMHFEQQVEMSQEDFDKVKDIDFNDVHEIRNRDQYSVIEGYLNFMDILQSDDEFLDVQITKDDE
jgi:rRNA maturation protein Rpf1